jgi:hypothetical protein
METLSTGDGQSGWNWGHFSCKPVNHAQSEAWRGSLPTFVFHPFPRPVEIPDIALDLLLALSIKRYGREV